MTHSQLAEHARKAWPHSVAYQIKWVRCVSRLGDKWVYAVPVKKGQS